MKASLITTERNEAKDIAKFIDSALTQSVEPDEIIIADGGSTDGTVQIIESYIKNGAPIKLIKASGNRSVGRNAATKAAHNEVIAVTDVGCRLDKDWFKNVVKPFEEDEKIMVVSGFFKTEPETFFEKVSSTLMLTDHDNIDSDNWLPSARSMAYKKEAWQKVGGYPEDMDFNEDTPFDLALKKVGYKFHFAKDAVVYWRPRPSIKEFFKQYFSYAKGDGLGLVHWQNYLKRTVKYIVGSFFVVLGFWFYSFWILTILGLIFYVSKRSLRVWRKFPRPRTLLLVPLLVIVDDLAELSGFGVGVLGRKVRK